MTSDEQIFQQKSVVSVVFQAMKENNCQPLLLYPVILPFIVLQKNLKESYEIGNNTAHQMSRCASEQ
jgi:hypothetical protein